MIDKFRERAVKNFNIKSKEQLPKSTNINSNMLRGIKYTNPFGSNEDPSFNSNINKTQSNLQKTCFYKTSYFLDKFDSK